MRALLVPLAVAGCGRLDFDPGQGAADARAGIMLVSSATGNNGTAATTVTSGPIDCEQGNLLVVMVRTEDSADTTFAVSDDAQNAFTCIPASLVNADTGDAGSGVASLVICYAHSIAAQVGDHVQATWTNENTNMPESVVASLIVRQYAGTDPSVPLDIAAGHWVPASDMTGTISVTLTPSNAGDLIVAVGVFDYGQSNVLTWTAGAGYVLGTNEPMQDVQSEDTLSAQAGPQDALLVCSQSGFALGISAAAFKPAT